MDDQDETPDEVDPSGATPAWHLDGLDPVAFEQEMYRLAEFVAWLQEIEIEVPDCWYAHGLIRDQLAAMQGWKETADPGREMVHWWEALHRWTESDPWKRAGGHYEHEVNGEKVRKLPPLADYMPTLLADRARNPHPDLRPPADPTP